MNFLSTSKPTPPPVVNGSAGYPQSRPAITTAIETITPDIARQYLGHANPNNRNVSRTTTIKYGRDMKEGRWTLTGEPIIFDETGMLADGHHRLTAAIDNNATFTSAVVRGIPADAITRIDGGRSRTAADMATMEQIPNAITACAIQSLILIHERWGAEFMNHSEKHPSKPEIVDALRQNPCMDLCVARAASVKKLLPKSIGGFCWYVFQQQNRQKADRLFEDLAIGENLSAVSPALILRNRLIENSTSKAKLPNLQLAAFMFKTWILYRDGKRGKQLRYADKGEFAERFPQI
jgi:hypothetical protein